MSKTWWGNTKNVVVMNDHLWTIQKLSNMKMWGIPERSPASLYFLFSIFFLLKLSQKRCPTTKFLVFPPKGAQLQPLQQPTTQSQPKLPIHTQVPPQNTKITTLICLGIELIWSWDEKYQIWIGQRIAVCKYDSFPPFQEALHLQIKVTF